MGVVASFAIICPTMSVVGVSRAHDQLPGVVTLMSTYKSPVHFQIKTSTDCAIAPSNIFVTAGELDERMDRHGLVHPPSAAQLPQAGRPLQTRQRVDLPEGVEEKFEFGSREADQAAHELHSLGCIVYPPGQQGTFDWGILAGAAQPPPACPSVFPSVTCQAQALLFVCRVR